ncbi:MAG: ATP-dependent DNA helicase RecG [Alphaproteobacteria bacterium]|nr:ATP-dependent DNA helicase RecG [Alphaproteobacteria bacterium]
MRPEALFPLFAPQTDLPGLGPRLATLVARATGGSHVVDLLWHMPSSLVDRRHVSTVAEAPVGATVTLAVRVEGHDPPPRPRLPYRVRCRDDSGAVTLVFFHGKPTYIATLLPEGSTRIVSGRLEQYGTERQIVHPDHVVEEPARASIQVLEPVYPLTEGLTPKVLRKAILGALARAPRLAEWIDPQLLTERGWPTWRDALERVHRPGVAEDIAPDSAPRTRLAYDELFASQLALGLMRAHRRTVPGRPVAGDGRLTQAARAALPFALTSDQEKAIAEILADMARPARMHRLLQGDVGSGKTVVAAMAMLTAVEAGFQAALMAPTEVLALQHHATLAPIAAAAGVDVALLIGSRGKDRGRALAALADGTTPLAVGTHALFQDEVAFKALALAVVDEQHRFGVHQRTLLAEKGKGAHVLVMTATPIPRTLQLAAFGDLDVSSLRAKPPGRQPIATRTIPASRAEEVIDAVGRAVAEGHKVYWVCPIVAESELLDVQAAEDRHRMLAERFGACVGLAHGQMPPAKRDAALETFAKGPPGILVATTVVEVGVDVPDATVMIVEHAERFGLAQLHQLRGRVGRGTAASTCILLYATPLGATARARLKVMRETDDGFVIAEEDLRLRGAGELLGKRQSGFPEFRLADLGVHADLLAVAAADARMVLNRDPGLATPRGAALRHLLYLFERDQAARLMRGG